MEEPKQQELDLMPATENIEPQQQVVDAEIVEGDEEENEVSSLFDGAFTDITGYMTEEEATEYIASILETGEIEHEASLFDRVTPYVMDRLKVTNYRPDQAVREASLAQKHMWRPGDGEISYLASNTLEVYLGTPERPLEIPQALKQIRQLSESTVLTARIVLGLWNIRRHNERVSKNGSVAVLLEEILQWQGIQKHSRVAHPGTNKRYTDGYRTEQKRRVLQDMTLLAACNVRGNCTISIRGKSVPIQVDGPYMRYSTVSKTLKGEKIIIGFLVSPGDWISTYEQHQNYYLAEVDNQIFKLNPQNDRYALRLALYLTERWREQAKTGNFSTPITMSELLASSMIEVDERHMTSRFVPRIEAALQKLENMGILGKQICLTEVNKEQTRWSKDWLASRWEILPPLKLIQEYQAMNTPRKRQRRIRAPKETKE
ncbi:hypothetical protein EI42_03620 [Thermosporothrix hazakensis]|jgi:hypothetical protein|uniref:Uncharacterized protein n=2 Tax=Thermosporothrix TaxID=768650 RepID=A0A326U4E7_THEHA|nr:hypothetical protein [Thermosporothrix hazakensis]PZW27533.1 hypothetical protein EI42_03620 [Thermosporothrix hazakensis]BBH85873.1 hypothetical protein KTC_06240 [Thermosporothrix sp. COM3]GCE45700.1 hypothetical protein KTH_05690 [Thermosporothrix hazakensis]